MRLGGGGGRGRESGGFEGAVGGGAEGEAASKSGRRPSLCGYVCRVPTCCACCAPQRKGRGSEISFGIVCGITFGARRSAPNLRSGNPLGAVTRTRCATRAKWPHHRNSSAFPPPLSTAVFLTMSYYWVPHKGGQWAWKWMGSGAVVAKASATVGRMMQPKVSTRSVYSKRQVAPRQQTPMASAAPKKPLASVARASSLSASAHSSQDRQAPRVNHALFMSLLRQAAAGKQVQPAPFTSAASQTRSFSTSARPVTADAPADAPAARWRDALRFLSGAAAMCHLSPSPSLAFAELATVATDV